MAVPRKQQVSGVNFKTDFFAITEFILLFKDSTGTGNGFLRLWYLVIHAKNILWLVFLYGFANLLSYYALARVEASVYTVLLQVILFKLA